jgi:hypothetical protein
MISQTFVSNSCVIQIYNQCIKILKFLQSTLMFAYPFDFSVFTDLKRQLKGQRFENLEELQSVTNTQIRQYPAEYYRNILFSKWPKRHERCIACSGSYFEKE